MLHHIIEGLPQNVEQIATAIATLVVAILAAFRKGKNAGTKQ